MTSRTSTRRRAQGQRHPCGLATPVFAGRAVTRLRTIDETAELLNVSPRTVRRLIDFGALPAHRLGRLVRIADGDLAVFLADSVPPSNVAVIVFPLTGDRPGRNSVVSVMVSGAFLLVAYDHVSTTESYVSRPVSSPLTSPNSCRHE